MHWDQSAVPLRDNVDCLYKVLAKNGTRLTVRGLCTVYSLTQPKLERENPRETVYLEKKRKEDYDRFFLVSLSWIVRSSIQKYNSMSTM